MERIELITGTKGLYKGNLHAHSTLSDGKQTPEELKKLYKANGYSFIAITDHEVLYDNSYLDDDEFITITSAEYGIKEFPNISTFGKENIKVCHLNIYAKQQHNLNNVCYNEPLDHYSTPEKKDQLLRDYGTTDRIYTVDAINKLISELNDAGFFVAYNHPRWSMENYSDYCGYEGLWGVEVYNHACTVIEATNHLQKILSFIREKGAKPMVALNPATPICMIENILEDVDAILVMTVNPGFAGQKLVPSTLKKIKDLRESLDNRGFKNIEIEVDGNVSFENAKLMKDAGANIFVGGTSSIFHKEHSIVENINRFRKIIS